ncbi:acetylornithine transaminase [Bacillus sp. 1P06AnD]|uniref:acetylornithine transaminase n=1 Tax=Bacillus sp. 1P06AnD TaxID=3132208 RepID=UPI0039A3E5CA
MSHLFQTYGRWNITPEYAEGSWLSDSDGKKYLDFTSGIGVLNLGHRPEQVKEALNRQIDRYWHTSNLFQQPLQEKLADILTEQSGLEYTFFCNSGAEANEAAIKLAKKATGRKKIISCLQSFHGRTYATMGATGQEKVRVGYGPMLEQFDYFLFNDVDDLQKHIDQDTAAIMIEIVQGEGGIHCAEKSFLKAVQEIAKENGALIIVDEVQTGIGRTGKPFAYQHFDFKPDIVTMAKGLGNGLPIGAMLGKAELSIYFNAGSHGSTFGGNPLSAAAACAVTDQIFKEDMLLKVREKGEYLFSLLREKLEGVPSVREIRGLGLMAGIEMDYGVNELLIKLQEDGLLILTAGPNTLRLLPPLNATFEEIHLAVEKLAQRLVKK